MKKLLGLDLVLAVLLCWLCMGSAFAEKDAATKDEKSEFEIESVKLLLDDGSGDPGQEVKMFRPSDRVQHFVVRMKSMKLGGVAGKWVFMGVNTAAGDDIKIAETTMSGLITNQFTGKLSLPKDWPIGIYRADLYANDKLLTSIDYVISLPLAEMKIRKTALYRDNGRGDAGEEVKSFLPSDHKQHFEAVGNGLFPGGTKVKWVYLAVETDAGNNKKIQEAETILEGPGDTLTGWFELPNDWPLGSYKTEVYINDQLFETIPYVVQKAALKAVPK